jgi:pimeloyl-ACP methyl ester carboxylesterase
VDVELRYNTVKGPKGKLEVISTVAENGREDLPYLYFIPGWWGRASDYIPVFKYFNGLGFRCRALSFRGTGASEGNSFWGHGFEHDLVPVLHYFADARIVLVPHSGAIDPVRHALPILHETGFTSRIKAIIAIAPLARSGAFPALVRFLKPDKSGTTLARWMRFLGSNVRGLSWFMKNELAIRRVLLADHCSMDSVKQVWSQVDRCAFGRYVLSLGRTFRQYKDVPFSRFGVQYAIVMHAELDQNFSTAQQIDTAKAIGAEFRGLQNACHQWFADPYTFKLTREQIISWLNEKGLYEPERMLASV